VNQPWACGPPLSPRDCAEVLRRAIFDCCKWHTQVEDASILCPFPLVLSADTWARLTRTAEALAREALAAERELLGRADLHHLLGLPRALSKALRSGGAEGPRVMRFDFHWTAEGYRITESNSDVAGGFIESSGVAQLFAAHYPGCRPAGDPAGALASAVGPGGVVGLMHLSVYTEDRQVMLYLAKRLAERGVSTCLFDPAQLRWSKGQAHVACDWYAGPLSLLVRFFPAEWLPRLPGVTGWKGLLAGGRTPVCNPGCAVLTQSKRFALAWDSLTTSLPTWRALLPETRSPAELNGRLDEGWVLKPALGHEGTDIGIEGVT
jgi:glutathionylspermidine synthase